IFNMDFFNDSTGYVKPSGFDTLYKTIDGGHNWILITTGFQYYTDFFWYSPTGGWAHSSGDSIIYTTNNSGLTWDSMYLPHPYYSARFQFFDSVTVWISGQGSNDSLMLTTDGGTTW